MATPIGITDTAGLSFGTLVSGGLGGTVVFSPNGALSSTGSVVSRGDPQAVSLSVTGGTNASDTITLPSSITVSDGVLNAMTVDSFVDGMSGAGTLDGTGNGSFTVGATLTVGMIQATGAYSGSFSVTVEYQ